jgi:hypothetical protein
MVTSIFNKHHDYLKIVEMNSHSCGIERHYEDVFIEKYDNYIILTKKINDNTEVIFKNINKIKKIIITNN